MNAQRTFIEAVCAYARAYRAKWNMPATSSDPGEGMAWTNCIGQRDSIKFNAEFSALLNAAADYLAGNGNTTHATDLARYIIALEEACHKVAGVHPIPLGRLLGLIGGDNPAGPHDSAEVCDAANVLRSLTPAQAAVVLNTIWPCPHALEHWPLEPAPTLVAVPATEASEGLRYDAGKIRVELMPVEWLEALAEVLTKGAQKYAPRNWEKGMAWSKMIGCAFRHTFKFMRGERYDRETGCHHLAHAAWNLLALMSYDVRGIGDNDLPYVATAATAVTPESL